MADFCNFFLGGRVSGGSGRAANLGGQMPNAPMPPLMPPLPAMPTTSLTKHHQTTSLSTIVSPCPFKPSYPMFNDCQLIDIPSNTLKAMAQRKHDDWGTITNCHYLPCYCTKSRINEDLSEWGLAWCRPTSLTWNRVLLPPGCIYSYARGKCKNLTNKHLCFVKIVAE